jgi:DNA end-binding protein Ku
MAGQVVESMTDDFHPEQYTDTYQEQLQEMVEAKLAGGQAFATTEAPAKLDDTEDVSDLLAKLEASVRRRREESAARTKAEPSDEPAAKGPAKKAPAKKAPAKAPAKAAAKKAPAKAAAKAPAKR